MPTINDIESYILNIEELIFDEKRIVTYSWLSKSLGIPSNLSKQLLHAFLENNPRILELCVTYLLIGLPKDDNTYKTLVVKDKDFEEVKNSFKSITSKHIYSIHKSLEYTDINDLYAAQKEDHANNILKGISAIDFNINERDAAVLSKLKFSALPEISNQTTVLKKANPQLCRKNNDPVKNEKNEESKNSKISKADEDLNLESKKALIPSMFKNSTRSENKLIQKVAANNKKTQGISAFFNKTTIKLNNGHGNATNEGKSKETTTGSEVADRISPLKENKATLNTCYENKVHTQNIVTKKEVSLEKEALLKSTQSSDSKLKSTSKKVNEKKNNKGISRKNKKEDKKRKRLVLLSDSDASNTTEDEDDVKREPTPEPQATLIPEDNENDDIISGTPEPSRKRKKKLVSKSYTSDDGYVITEKQYVEASCSEGEESAPEKKFKESKLQDNNLANIEVNSKTSYVQQSSRQQKNKSPKNNNPSPQKTKQASLMSFFKKK